MHEVVACRHIDPAARPDVAATRSRQGTSRHAFDLVADASHQELATTASRQLRRDSDFLAAARFMVGAGFHAKAGRTTLRLAEAFALRMHRSKDGHFPFSIEATAHELGLGRRAVLNHARYLRELGLLAYVEHGTRTNVLRTRHGSAWVTGYRGTATLFAAVAPRVWDRAMGRRIKGTGYMARQVGVTEEGRRLAVEDARLRAAFKAPARRSSCTPSVGVPQEGLSLKTVGGNTDTPRTRATTTRRTAVNGPRVSAAECARGVSIAERLQREVWWLHRGCARRLACALRPLTAAGWTWQSLAAELLTWGVPGFLRDPAAYVRHELARRQRLGHLPHLTASVVADDRVDEHGTRRTDMLRRREEAHHPAWQRYSEQLRPQLRRQLAEARATRPVRQTPPVSRPMWREPEEDFLASLPDQSWGNSPAPREVYAARAWGRRPRSASRTPPSSDQGWLEELRDQAEAERACAALRAELENWAAGRG